MHQRVFLLGYRACGKSTVAPLLAQAWQVPCIDVDGLISEEAGKPISAIFAEEGEAAFRELEARKMAALLLAQAPAVIATGGGCVVSQTTRAALADSAHPVVYLQAPAAVLQQRLRIDAGGRPSLSGTDVATEVPDILAERDPWYRSAASLVVDATQPVECVVARIREHVENSSSSG